jgi:hypothetical protein
MMKAVSARLKKEIRLNKAVKLCFDPETNLGGSFFNACYRWKVDILSNLFGMEYEDR